MKNSSCLDAKMEAYCEEVRCLEDKFFGLELNHVARRYNEVPDKLEKIASGWTAVPPNIFPRDIFKPSVVPKEASELTPHEETPPTDRPEAMQIDGDKDQDTLGSDWRTPYLDYLLQGELPLGKTETRRLTRRAKTFVLIREEKDLYRHRLSGIIQRCIPISQG